MHNEPRARLRGLMRVQERTGAAEQRTSPAPGERFKGLINIAVAPGIEDDEMLPSRLRRGLYVSPLFLGLGTVRVHKHSNRRRFGHEFAQQLQPLVNGYQNGWKD
jgi:hypothetical protein